MRSTLTILAVLATQAACYSINSEMEQKFLAWATKHGKQYLTALEFGQRLQNWIKMDK